MVLSFISYRKKLEIPKMGCKGLFTSFSWFLVNEFVSRYGIWDKAQPFLLPFFSCTFLILSLSSDENREKIVISKRTNCIIGLGLLSVVYLFISISFYISGLTMALISRFLSKFSILEGDLRWLCFHLLCVWKMKGNRKRMALAAVILVLAAVLLKAISCHEWGITACSTWAFSLS